MNKYQPIENYGVIGNLRTIALVGLNGSIDFMCFPNFDSPSIFASILDFRKGGNFSITSMNEDVKYKQLYFPETNVLYTRFLSAEGVGELIDFMPVIEVSDSNVLIRRVTCVRGNTKYRMTCSPGFNYARSRHTIEQVNDNEIIFRSLGEDKTTIRLLSSINLAVKENDSVLEFTLNQGGVVDFILGPAEEKNSLTGKNINHYVTENLFATVNYWKEWSALLNYSGRWREIVNRSALVLKLLTSYKHGSLIASPTFSLPEYIGGDRNWDYRYTWIRDASFTIYTMINLGYRKEATAFMKWIEKECEDLGKKGSLSLMYTIDGNNIKDETILENLEGYKNSRPVRIGNNAKKQIQLDIYGELMDSVYLYNKYVEPISYKFWGDLELQINWVCDNWTKKDEGIWEVRGGEREFLYSRLMCWVAIDRAIKLAVMRSFPLDQKWVQERDKIFKSIFNDFWNNDLHSFVQYKGSDTVDAATLLMPLMRFISPRDPMWLSTMKEIEKELVSDSLVFRYRQEEKNIDGLKTGEGTFSMCTFWYIECLSGAGQLQKARLFFEKMLGYANHLGLYAEQLGFQGEHLGNYPQAFTHLGLISAVVHLNKTLSDERNKQQNNNNLNEEFMNI